MAQFPRGPRPVTRLMTENQAAFMVTSWQGPGRGHKRVEAPSVDEDGWVGLVPPNDGRGESAGHYQLLYGVAVRLGCDSELKAVVWCAVRNRINLHFIASTMKMMRETKDRKSV